MQDQKRSPADHDSSNLAKHLEEINRINQIIDNGISVMLNQDDFDLYECIKGFSQALELYKNFTEKNPSTHKMVQNQLKNSAENLQLLKVHLTKKWQNFIVQELIIVRDNFYKIDSEKGIKKKSMLSALQHRCQKLLELKPLLLAAGFKTDDGFFRLITDTYMAVKLQRYYNSHKSSNTAFFDENHYPGSKKSSDTSGRLGAIPERKVKPLAPLTVADMKARDTFKVTPVESQMLKQETQFFIDTFRQKLKGRTLAKSDEDSSSSKNPSEAGPFSLFNL